MKILSVSKRELDKIQSNLKIALGAKNINQKNKLIKETIRSVGNIKERQGE